MRVLQKGSKMSKPTTIIKITLPAPAGAVAASAEIEVEGDVAVETRPGPGGPTGLLVFRYARGDVRGESHSLGTALERASGGRWGR